MDFDSGASSHKSGYMLTFTYLFPLNAPIPVALEHDSVLNGTHRDSVPLVVQCTAASLKEMTCIRLCDILFIPGFKRCLVFVSKLLSRGIRVMFQDAMCYIMRCGRGR
jgi:hypothetical protein